jgi:DNA-binding response OmpR family regulator
MSKSGIKILIIDYEPRGIKQLNDPLELAGYEIRIAKDGVAGIEAFNKEKPDLVLIEAMLPKRHGFEVCQEIKRTDHGRRTPVVIVTSVYKGRKYRSQAKYQYGCDEYLEKPVAADKLLEIVDGLLAQRQGSATGGAGTVEAAKPATPAPRDATEAEIIDRLDQILGDTKGTTGGSGSSG